LKPAANEKCILTDEERVGPLALKRCKSRSASHVALSIRLGSSSPTVDPATGIVVIDISAVLDSADASNDLSGLIEFKT
jgi:hypothetical protein